MEEINKMENTNGPIIEKANNVAGHAFKLNSETPFDVLKTSYAYWLHNNNQVTDLNPEGGKIRPMVARDKDGAFEVYRDGGWVAEDKGQYFYTEKDKEGNPQLKANGQPQRRFYFDKYFEYPVTFKDGVEVEVWNKEEKKVQVITTERARLRVKTSLNARIQEYITDPRNKDTFLEITFNKEAMPAEMYGVRYNS